MSKEIVCDDCNEKLKLVVSSNYPMKGSTVDLMCKCSGYTDIEKEKLPKNWIGDSGDE